MSPMLLLNLKHVATVTVMAEELTAMDLAVEVGLQDQMVLECINRGTMGQIKVHGVIKVDQGEILICQICRLWVSV